MRWKELFWVSLLSKLILGNKFIRFFAFFHLANKLPSPIQNHKLDEQDNTCLEGQALPPTLFFKNLPMSSYTQFLKVWQYILLFGNIPLCTVESALTMITATTMAAMPIKYSFPENSSSILEWQVLTWSKKIIDLFSKFSVLLWAIHHIKHATIRKCNTRKQNQYLFEK